MANETEHPALPAGLTAADLNKETTRNVWPELGPVWVDRAALARAAARRPDVPAVLKGGGCSIL